MKKLFFILLMIAAAACSAQQKGFNNPWFFNQFPGGYPPDSVVNKIIALKNATATDTFYIRFPGGTIANRYITDSTGYGGQTADKNPNYITAQVKLCQQTGAKTIYVANLYQPLINPQLEAWYIADIVKAVKILNPAKIELGNELQIYPEITGVTNGSFNIFNRKKNTEIVTANAKRYTALAYKVMAAIRTAGYNPQFGMCMDLPLHDRGKIWNQVIREWGRYDAEIFHVYSLGRDILSIQNELNKYFNGSKKQIWVTEWAFLLGSDAQNPKNAELIGTESYNAFPFNFATAVSYDNRIKISLRHMMYGNTEYCVIKTK